MLNKGKKVTAIALAAGVAVPALMSNGASAAGVPVKSVKFNGMEAPATAEDMSKPYTTASVEVTYANGNTKTFELSWDQLFNSKDYLTEVNGTQVPASTPLDVNGNPIKKADEGGIDYYISDAPDGNSVIEGPEGKKYLISHFESHANGSGSVPDSMTLTELEQKEDGKLEVADVKPIDFSEVNGIWVPCNASTSPWNTHLGSEEYEPDARSFFEDKESRSYQDVTNFAENYFGDASKANPYFYGWTPEISVVGEGETKAVKHYSMGRFSKEVAKVMEDNKTVLFGDDGTDVVLFMYVADKAEDLTSGSLYAAKYTGADDMNGQAEEAGAGTLEWIKLGHASDDEIENLVNSGITFQDMFEVSDEPKEGFKAIKTNSTSKVEYLKLKPGMEKAAAFLESRRYAAYKGATSEFRKMEGVAVNKNDNKAYVAISEINKGMTKAEEGSPVADDIQIEREDAGAVYEMPLAGDQKDAEGNAIHSHFVPKAFDGLVMGQTMDDFDELGNLHDPGKVSNPDNLSFSNEMNTLFIGEDSGADEGHVNNFVWAYSLDNEELERILSVPAGAEATGLLPVEDMDGYSYIMSSFQHPGSGVEDSPISAVNKEELLQKIEENYQESAGLGYIKGLSLEGFKMNGEKTSKEGTKAKEKEQSGAENFFFSIWNKFFQ